MPPFQVDYTNVPDRFRTILDVWTAELDAVGDARLEEYRTWLTSDERDACERFATPRLRGEYLLTRALSRWVLSQYEPSVAPVEWRFARTEAGRPFVIEPAAKVEALPTFNLANADGFVVCAACTVPIGVDVEPSSRGDELLATAPKIFSASECAALAALGDDVQRARRAVELWTLKEAYLKARGHGIAVRLERITIAAPKPPKDRWTLGEPSVIDDDTSAWQLEIASDPHRTIAVAVQRGTQADLELVLRPVVPSWRA